jgi:hypothetical protein
MCQEWVDDFWAFVEAVGIRPEGHTLRRLNTKHPLGPHNWEWKESMPSVDKAEYQRKWRNSNPDRAKHHDLKKMYGITLKQYEDMFAAQNERCAICKGRETTMSKDGAPRRMPVDHCHETGRIRGLLCTQCNRGLGMFRDSVKNLYAAAAYLQKQVDSDNPE